MQPGLSCLLLHISCLFKAGSPLSFPVDADQAPFYSSWKSSSREQEIKRNAKDIDKRRSERERKMWEMETGERGEQSSCEREQEWERRCEGDVCKCVRVEERGARESDIQKKRGEAQEKPSYVLITHVRPIITLQGHPLTGKMKAALERQTLTPPKDNSFPPACSQAAVTNSGDAWNTVSMEMRIPITTSSRAWCFI